MRPPTSCTRCGFRSTRWLALAGAFALVATGANLAGLVVFLGERERSTGFAVTHSVLLFFGVLLWVVAMGRDMEWRSREKAARKREQLGQERPAYVHLDDRGR